ncbi:4-hydroxybenzoate polyprenyltransferase [Agromyces flavus]|uniref:4-hydroxybenzoate polyprenyltransferase n=1 Tax=Agromyces flavus TaxID=589382 RepID=A0A1H1X3L8_9MICO|nr:UbiA family prenyltransferase [Agromyces flavus]MCP2366327.1 4-hydroxybenzoate polyprenyltransferase [Agromyces flavus]GGI44452.1 transferase [Agromyces flavus]SDT03914.1 4-hydroxybenzoate polyprenyltransferase [Agromyces flavus]
MASASTFLQLVRAPAGLTVLGDATAGMASVGRTGLVPRLGLPIASVLLYWGGMALNDAADAELDRVERPERPIPSGRITRRGALGVAGALTVAGVAVAGLTGGRSSLAVAVPLAASIWTYDLVAKRGWTGPIVMAACRGLDVLLGAGRDRAGDALRPALVMAGHTASVTALARGEVHGTRPAIAAAVSATTVAAGVAAVRPEASVAGVVSAAAAARFAVPTVRAQAAAVRSPSASVVRTATRRGILGMVPLQAALTARAGRPVDALVLLAIDAVATRLARRGAAKGRDVT